MVLRHPVHQEVMVVINFDNVSELLRVALQVEKISNQGIGIAKGHMPDVPFLLKGWIKVAKRQSFKTS